MDTIMADKLVVVKDVYLAVYSVFSMVVMMVDIMVVWKADSKAGDLEKLRGGSRDN